MRFLRQSMVFLVGAGIGFGGWFAWFANRPLALAGSPVDVSIESGGTLTSVTRQLIDAGVRMRGWDFRLLARLLGKASAIKAGSYEIEPGTTPLALLAMLTRGDLRQVNIALIEGWTFRQIRTALDAHPDLQHETRGLTDSDILQRVGATEDYAEGLFFPDTYLFARQSSDTALLRRAYREMRRHLQLAWDARPQGLPYKSPYEALIMASIIEKETGKPEDRPLIAAVFVNRLRAGMLLQTDPTVIYGLGARFDGNLRKRDLTSDGPYNTYLRAGLPPTPIAMPGVASLKAALNPPDSDHLYFVARGDGSSVFSRTLDEHNRAVAQFQKKR
ncbi:MAG: endolytic transglycosylase MltG [Candidatus Methylophosphatis roskildensis]